MCNFLLSFTLINHTKILVMKKVLLLATAVLLITGVSFADNGSHAETNVAIERLGDAAQQEGDLYHDTECPRRPQNRGAVVTHLNRDDIGGAGRVRAGLGHRRRP